MMRVLNDRHNPGKRKIDTISSKKSNQGDKESQVD